MAEQTYGHPPHFNQSLVENFSSLLKGFFWIPRRYGQPSQMFRQCDGDHNGCISIDEFVEKTRQLDLQPRITRADVENMTEVLQFAGDGYEPFICVKNDCL